MENPGEEKPAATRSAQRGPRGLLKRAEAHAVGVGFREPREMASFSVFYSARQESVLAIGGKKTKIALR